MIRVLVTRPEPGASRTVQRLELLGFAAIKVAFTEMSGVAASGLDGEYDVVLATSAQAFSHLPSDIALQLRGHPCFVVGQATASAARLAGFDNIEAVSANVEDLLALLAARLVRCERAVYLCGKVRRSELETALAAQMVHVKVLEVYDTSPVLDLAQRLETALHEGAPHAVFVTSLTSAKLLYRALQAPHVAKLLSQVQFFCLSSRIALALSQASDCRTFVAERPDENGLIASLMAQYPTSN